MRLIAILAVAVWAAAPTRAETLADIRQDLAVLTVELNRLKVELSTTGGSSVVLQGASVSERLASIERALQRLTGKTEELEFRIDSVVKDGTNRIGDLEFRVCEVEPDCDFSQLGTTAPLGHAEGSQVVSQPDDLSDTQSGLVASQLAVGEQADFQRAQQALADGNYRAAADQFSAFRATYPGGPLEAQALVGQGRAQEGLGDTRAAARAFLDAYSGYPQSDIAPEALFRLGQSLGDLGAVSEACVTLGEVGVRYPGTAAVSDAQSAMAVLGCS
ncbi:MAG: tol-pal system protein YbgF [Rhodobacteraceae bacterium]|nr:tol-pal system protein YbgF [Paracoccaceae bacterium]